MPLRKPEFQAGPRGRTPAHRLRRERPLGVETGVETGRDRDAGLQAAVEHLVGQGDRPALVDVADDVGAQVEAGHHPGGGDQAGDHVGALAGRELLVVVAHLEETVFRSALPPVFLRMSSSHFSASSAPRW
jgi:hypothetical protein